MLGASAAHPVRNAADHTTFAPLLKTKHVLGCFKHVQPNRATPCVSAFPHNLAAELVGAADTPVGKGLVSTQQIGSHTQILQASWDEVVAVFTPACYSQQHTMVAASAAYSAMPKQLLKFVQGSTGSWDLDPASFCLHCHAMCCITQALSMKLYAWQQQSSGCKNMAAPSGEAILQAYPRYCTANGTAQAAYFPHKVPDRVKSTNLYSQQKWSLLCSVTGCTD